MSNDHNYVLGQSDRAARRTGVAGSALRRAVGGAARRARAPTNRPRGRTRLRTGRLYATHPQPPRAERRGGRGGRVRKPARTGEDIARGTRRHPLQADAGGCVEAGRLARRCRRGDRPGRAAPCPDGGVPAWPTQSGAEAGYANRVPRTGLPATPRKTRARGSDPPRVGPAADVRKGDQRSVRRVAHLAGSRRVAGADPRRRGLRETCSTHGTRSRRTRACWRTWE